MTSSIENGLVVAADAGAGHLRPAIALAEELNIEFGIISIPATKVHQAGSSGLLKLVTELIQSSQFLQEHLHLPVVRKSILKNLPSEASLDPELISILKNGGLLVSTNPEVSLTLVELRKKLSPDPCQCKIVTVLTDHFPVEGSLHLFWALAEVDYIVAPDENTLNVVEKTLDKYWPKHFPNRPKPKVYSQPFPIDKNSGKNLPENLLEARRQRLNSQNTDKKPFLALLLGGAGVQADYMATLAKSTKWAIPWSTFKPAPGIHALETAIESMGGTTAKASNNEDLIRALNEKTHSDPADIIVVKPGELSNYPDQFPTNAYGGAIMFFSPPVGHQEKMNLVYLREQGKLLDKELSQKLISDVLSGKINTSFWQDKLSKMRCLVLPKNPQDAARFISVLYEKNLLLQIFEHNQVQ